MKQINVLYLFVLIFLFLPGCSTAEPGLIEILNSVNKVYLCGKEVPLDKNNSRERLEKELLLISNNKPQVILWLKRSARYFPQIEKILKEQNLPDDLKYVSVIESALIPHIRSPKNALGFWQFISSTGSLYGLKIDRSIDERCDLEKSTLAASMYFKDLYEKFENWELAFSAYNIGELRIKAELQAQSADNYYDLWLPEETMRYVFRIIAAKIVFENRDKFGFSMAKSDYYKPFNTKEVKLELENTIPGSIPAHALGLSLYEFKLLNTKIVGDYLTQGSVDINIPENIKTKKFLKKFEKLKNKWIEEHTRFYYSVQKGDSLIKISEEFQVRTKDILEWNELNYRDFIYPGQKLIIKTNLKNLKD